MYPWREPFLEIGELKKSMLGALCGGGGWGGVCIRGSLNVRSLLSAASVRQCPLVGMVGTESRIGCHLEVF